MDTDICITVMQIINSNSQKLDWDSDSVKLTLDYKIVILSNTFEL